MQLEDRSRLQVLSRLAALIGMRHSNCRCTLEIYSQARIQAKRDAQHRVIQMIVPWKGATEVQVA